MMTMVPVADASCHRAPPRRSRPIARWLGRPGAVVPASAPCSREETATPASTRGRDPRRLTPREMATLSLELYVSGRVGYDDYALLAFQPDLHRDYDATIGALTGVAAQPDRPRDFIALWEDRLRFEGTYGGEDRQRIGRIQHILHVLRTCTGATEAAG